MPEKETSSNERKIFMILLPAVAVIAFLLGILAFSVVSKNGDRAGSSETGALADANAEKEQPRQEEVPANANKEQPRQQEAPANAEKEQPQQEEVFDSESVVMAEGAGGNASASQAAGNMPSAAPADLSGGRGASALSPADTGNSAFIGEAAAKEAALADAGVEESDIVYLNCYVDYDDGRPEHYNVDFAVGNMEYEYEIDLYLGTVLEKGAETYIANHNHHKTAGTENSAGTYIGEEAAWTVALNHAGLKEAEVTKKKVKLDEEDGVMVYEVEFEMGRVEYDYEIHAVSGEILKAEMDRD